ncbi:hypothetical protein HDU97_001846 [Phlyctochytrium planicorne]|nr:hypothetical protein HDU97_001846 [Phlyctochytrium planicorne]
MSAPSKFSAASDVLQFLEDLDSLNLNPPSSATKTSSSTAASATPSPSKKPVSSQDVLSFLDELTTPPSQSTSPTKPKTLTSPSKPQSRQTSKSDMENMPSASELFAPKESDGQPKPVVAAAQRNEKPTSAGPAAAAAAAAATKKPEATSTKPQPEEIGGAGGTSEDGGWGWNTLWATASKVTSTAQHMVEDAAKVVTSEKVKGVVANVTKEVAESVNSVVSKETVQKYSSDLQKFTASSVSTISEILAPPISPTAARAYVRRKSAAGLLARTITLWLCAQTFDPAGPSDQRPTADQIHDFVQATGTTLWITDKPGQGLCSKLNVNGVANPDPKSAQGLTQAMEIAEKTLQKLVKFSDKQREESANGVLAKIELEDEQRAFLIIQPFATLVASTVFGADPHMQFLIMLVHPKPSQEKFEDATVVTAVSQSLKVLSDSSSVLSSWSEDQTGRVIETAITDVFEEFSIRCSVVPA